MFSWNFLHLYLPHALVIELRHEFKISFNQLKDCTIWWNPDFSSPLLAQAPGNPDQPNPSVCREQSLNKRGLGQKAWEWHTRPLWLQNQQGTSCAPIALCPSGSHLTHPHLNSALGPLNVLQEPSCIDELKEVRAASPVAGVVRPAARRRLGPSDRFWIQLCAGQSALLSSNIKSQCSTVRDILNLSQHVGAKETTWKETPFAQAGLGWLVCLFWVLFSFNAFQDQSPLLDFLVQWWEI